MFLYCIILLVIYWYNKENNKEQYNLQYELDELISKRNAYILSIIKNENEIEMYTELSKQIRHVRRIMDNKLY